MCDHVDVGASYVFVIIESDDNDCPRGIYTTKEAAIKASEDLIQANGWSRHSIDDEEVPALKIHLIRLNMPTFSENYFENGVWTSLDGKRD